MHIWFVSKMKIDAVIAVKNESSKLHACCMELFKKVPINNLIIVVGKSRDNTLETAKKFANIVIEDENKGIGYARNLGLKKVETKYYASIDSDVVLSKNWYPWCIDTIQKPHVAACEGYPRSLGAYYATWQRLELTQGYCSLGNTMLNSSLVRKIGMPLVAWGEDHVLKERFESKGYKWVVNPDIVSAHLVNDIEMLRHYIKFGVSVGKNQSISYWYLIKNTYWSLKDFALQGNSLGFNPSIYFLLLRLTRNFSILYGSFVKKQTRLVQ